ncbi:MAG: tetratricopeptide repeat protein, partial [Pyrinomonadaceae bacterium]|nr:tetratricopeptide repeat protein [Pyrinomonadaceae bacterium]
MIEALFIEIVGAVLFERGRQGLGKFFTESPARKAINTTAACFPNIPVVDAALTKWCKSEDFAAQHAALQAGYDQQADERLVNSFIDAGGFYDGINNTHDSARLVLEAFFKHLEEEVYKTEFAAIIEARRSKLRDDAALAGINDLNQQVQRLPSDFEAVLHKTLGQYVPQFNPEHNPAVQEKIHFAAIDLAVELLKEGRAKSARRRLEDLRAKLASENPSVDLRFRLTANLGSCALQLNDYKTAEREYEAALSLKPEHRLVLSYAALTAMITDNSERALEYARRSWPADERDPQITSTYLRVLHHVNREDEIERLLREEDWIERDPNCALALGLIRLSQQNYGQAEAYFTTALRGEVENPHVHGLLAQTIIHPIDHINSNNPPLKLSGETIARIGEAEGHLTRAVELFEKYENPSGLYEALLQRAYVRGLLGQAYASLADCDRLLTTNPKDANALYQKGHTLLFAGRIEEALQCFSMIEAEDERRSSMLSIALAYNRSQRYDKVIETLSDNWPPAKQARRQLVVADLLLNAYHHTGNAERAESLISDLERARADDPDALVVIARHHMRSGRGEEALALYKTALEQAAAGNQRMRISSELADYYYEAGEWAAAAQLYKETVDESDDNVTTRRYLTSLYNSGARRDALRLARRLRGDGEAIPFVSDIEARVLAAAGEPEEALRLYTQLARLEPQEVSHRLCMVGLQRRLKNYEGARETLRGITLDEVKNDPPVLIQVAELRQQLDLGGDLPFAYRARRIGFNDKDVHDAYFELFKEHTYRESGDLDVECVAVDFAVHLQDAKGEKKTYLIVEQDEYDIQHGEIPPTDPRAVEMLGKRTGDTVVFNQGRADEIEYEIVDVQSKYVYAFQQTIIRHNEWFSGSDTMMVMD